MQENFEDALKAVLMHEGGFVTPPDDPEEPRTAG